MGSRRTIELERDGRVGIIRFNRPEVLNAFNAEMTRELQEALDELNADAGIGAIVTTGNGRAYSSGSDIGGAPSQPDPGPAHDIWDPEFLAADSKPLIAAVNGLAIGMGLTTILWWDTIIASTEARFSMRFAAIGLTPELSSAWILPHIIGVQNAREMMLTGRIYGAQEALELGLVRRVVEPDRLLPEATALAQEIAANPVSTLRRVKSMVYRDYFAPDIEAVKQNSHDNFQAALRTPERQEALLAFREKRDPRFDDAEYMEQLAAEMRQS